MKRVRSRAQGFTMVETMIFLAVSAALLISALALIAGKQRSTEFTQAINQIEAVIRDQLNDVATGTYPLADGVACSVIGGRLRLVTNAATDLGTNNQCIFIGKVIQIGPGAPGGNEHSIRVYTVAGKRLNGINEVTNIQAALPCLLAQGANSSLCTGGANYPNKPESFDFTPAVRIYAPATESFAIGVFTTFRSGLLTDPDAIAADIVRFDVSGLGINKPQLGPSGFVQTVTERLHSGLNQEKNPEDGTSICINSEGTNQSALLIIGAQTSGVSTRIDRFEKRNCAP